MKNILTLGSLLCALSAHGASVTLAWDKSPSTNIIADYRVYWGVASHTYTNYASSGTNLTVTITNLKYDVRYWFAATATDTSGLESDFSNEVSTTIPTPTNWVSLGLVIESKAGLTNQWVQYKSFGLLTLTNPPSPAYFRSRLSITSSNNGIGVMLVNPSTMLFTNK